MRSLRWRPSVSDEKLLQVLKWLPLLIAVGYFTFLIGSWYKFLQVQNQKYATFEEEYAAWRAGKDAANSDES